MSPHIKSLIMQHEKRLRAFTKVKLSMRTITMFYVFDSHIEHIFHLFHNPKWIYELFILVSFIIVIILMRGSLLLISRFQILF